MVENAVAELIKSSRLPDHIRQLQDYLAEEQERRISPSTEFVDRGDKFRDYAANGVREYWIVDPDAQTVEQYVAIDGAYTLQVKLRSGMIASTVVTGFEIPVRAIFDVQENRNMLRKIING